MLCIYRKNLENENFCNFWFINTKNRDFRQSSKGSSDIEEGDVGGGVANTETVATHSRGLHLLRIVQECRVPLFLPSFLLLGYSSFLPSFPCYITRRSLPARSVSVYVPPVVSISRTRYSLDRYASWLSLFCLSNTHSIAMWVRIARPLCSCSCSCSCSHKRRDNSLFSYCLHADRDIILFWLSYLSWDTSHTFQVCRVSYFSLKDLRINTLFLSLFICFKYAFFDKVHNFFI